MHPRTHKQVLVLLSAIFLLAGCAGSRQASTPGPTPGRPEWVDKGGGFYPGDRGKAFYGVGVASNISLVSLRRSTADAQARAALARVFKTKIANLVKVYARSVYGSEQGESAEQFAQEATRAFTSMELSGVQIIDHYFDPQEKALYALAVLDMTSFKDQLNQMHNLNQQVKQLILENANKAFEELEQLENP